MRRIEPGMNDLFRRHRERLQEFADGKGCRYVDISSEIGVVEDDYRDWFHLRKEETARRYTIRLAEYITASQGTRQ